MNTAPHKKNKVSLNDLSSPKNKKKKAKVSSKNNLGVRDSHVHGPQHFKQCDKQQLQKVLIICSTLVASFMIIEFIGGILSGSLALIADSAHMFTDLIALFLAFWGIIVSQIKNNTFKTYGYSRFEVVLSLINSIFLFFVCLFIIYEAFKRVNSVDVINIRIMLPVACAGLAVNLVTMYLFYKNNKSESQKGNQKNLLMQGAFLNFLMDAFGSFVTIISAIIIYYTQWHIIDPLLSFVLVFFISKAAWKLANDSIHILMEGSPRDISNLKIERALENQIPEVIDVHHIHLWMLNEQENIITLHIVVKKGYNVTIAINKVKEFLYEKYNIAHSTIQGEEEGKSCLDFHH